MRVVFDVNVLIRLTFGSSLVARLLRAANAGAFTVIAADILMDELTSTARKPRLADRINLATHEDLVAFLNEEADFISPREPFSSCRDRDDDYLLALARDGGADFLITNDQDLLSLGQLSKCEIIKPEEFAHRLGPTA